MLNAMHLLAVIALMAMPASGEYKSQYKKFLPSEREIDAHISPTFRRCIVSTESRMPAATECFQKEHLRLHRKFDVAYQQVLERPPNRLSKADVIADDISWTNDRKMAYKEIVDRLGGSSAAKLAGMHRNLREVVRRYLWLKTLVVAALPTAKRESGG